MSRRAAGGSIALRSFGVPGAADVLDRMVEILAHAERNLKGGA